MRNTNGEFTEKNDKRRGENNLNVEEQRGNDVTGKIQTLCKT